MRRQLLRFFLILTCPVWGLYVVASDVAKDLLEDIDAWLDKKGVV